MIVIAESPILCGPSDKVNHQGQSCGILFQLRSGSRQFAGQVYLLNGMGIEIFFPYDLGVTSQLHHNRMRVAIDIIRRSQAVKPFNDYRNLLLGQRVDISLRPPLRSAG